MMRPTVRDKADAVATWRSIAVTLMETLARWVPTTPQLEAKALFGRHIWDLAQLADRLGHRAPELRAALHETRAPRRSYADALEQLAATTASGDRLAGFYDAAFPDLIRRFAAALEVADPLLDEPTIRILEGAAADAIRILSQRDDLLAERPDLRAHDADRLRRLRAALAGVPDPIEPRAGVPVGAA